MAKRFTDSNKWKDPFFEQLTKDLKLAWLYLLDDCDHAGIWKKSIKRLNFSLDTNFTEKDLLEAFKERITVLDADKWFIVKFITFQYGNEFIKSKQKAVVSVIKILNEHNLIKELDNGILTLSIPLTNPMNTLMDQDQDKDMDQDKEKDKNKIQDRMLQVYNSPDIIQNDYTSEIENTDNDFVISREMLDRVIDKFISVDSRFKLQSVMSEIDEDYGGFQNLIEMYLPNDISAQRNYINQLNQYKNGIYG